MRSGNPFSTSSCRFFVLSIAISFASCFAAGELFAQESSLPRRDRDRDTPGQTSSATPSSRSGSELWQERLLRPGRPERERLILGVYANPIEAGYRVYGVAPRTPAARAGIEPGDVILAVDGYQVGTVGRAFYSLWQEIQTRGETDLHTVLLVRNVRNGQVLNLDVHFNFDRPLGGTIRDRYERETNRSNERGRSTPSPFEQSPLGTSRRESSPSGRSLPADTEVKGERKGELH